MKGQILLFSLFSMLLCGGLSAQSILWEEDFETDGNGTRYTVSHEFFDDKDDYFGRVYGPTEEYGSMGSGNVIDVIGTGGSSTQNGQYAGYNGNFFIGGEDQDDDGGDGIDEKEISFTIDISTGKRLDV
jgi:hypothetical protein